MLKEVEEIPEQLDDVLQFIRFLKYRRRQEIFEIIKVSESSLGKEWLLPEEDEARQNL